MKQLVFTSILMLVVMAADTEEDMEITFTFERYVDLKRLKTSKYDMVHYNILYITYNQNVSVNSPCSTGQGRSTFATFLNFKLIFLEFLIFYHNFV